MRQTIKAVGHAVLASAFLAAVPVACGGTGDPSPQSNETALTPTSETLLTRTIVRRAADGTEKVAVDQITRAQQIAEAQEREAIKGGARIPETLTETCSNAYVALYDASGNEICFYNAGSSTDSANLGNYCETGGWPCYGTRWAGDHINSWVTNNEAATITAASGGACDYSCLKGHPCVCAETINLPANSSACGSLLFCTYLPPSNIDSTMNYLWMGTVSTPLCSLCPNN